MTASSYALIEMELAEAEGAAEGAAEGVADRLRREARGRAGVAVVLRDEGAVVGFEMLPRARLETGPASGLPLEAAREAAIVRRLRRRLSPDPGPRPRLSVAVCTKDRPDWTARLLASLLPQRERTPFEVLVVDNAPSDEATRRAAEAAPGVRYLREPRAGLDFARNRAVAEATGEVLAFLDDDVAADPGWAEALSRAWAESPDAGAVTGLVLPMALDTEAQVLFERRGGFRRGHLPLRWGATAAFDPLHPCGAGKFGAGANMSVHVPLVRALGGFDEALDTGRPLPGGGDLDIFYRVLRAGRSLVYEPQAAVFHEHRREMAVLRRQYRTWGLGFAAFLAKSRRADPSMRPALRRMAWWWFAHQAGRAGRRLLGREPTPIGMIAAEIAGGVKGLWGEYERSERRSALIRERSA